MDWIETRSQEMQTYRVSEDTTLLVHGDPHGDLEAARFLLREFSSESFLHVCVGDVIGYRDGPESSKLCELYRSRGVPCVEGNHEDWSKEQGKLFLVEERGSSRTIEPDALEWIRGLPVEVRFRFFRQGKALEEVCGMIHSIRDPRWEWIDRANVGRFTERIGRPWIVLTGHSHHPRLYELHKGKLIEVHALEGRPQEELRVELRGDRHYLLDAGSISRAEFLGKRSKGESRCYGFLNRARAEIGLRVFELPKG